jgi:Leucine-rich repeat (LRR) protein
MVCIFFTCKQFSQNLKPCAYEQRATGNMTVQSLSLTKESKSKADLEGGAGMGASIVASSPATSPKADKKNRRRSTTRYVLTTISILLIGAVIAVGVVVTGNMKRSNRALNPRQQELDNVVTSISDPSALANPNSAQAMARHWLVHNDDLWTGDKAAGLVVTTEMAAQRYVLAVFYFATSGPSSWIGGNKWLQGQECTNGWAGIKCNKHGQVRALVFGKSPSLSVHKSSQAINREPISNQIGCLFVHSFAPAERQGLTGTIPVEVGKLSGLESMILKQELRLSGSIPSSIGNLRSLRQLVLSHSKLVGTMPAELFLLTSLAYVNLGSNAMSGTLSPDVSKLRALETLVLSDNHFEGTIPFDSLAWTGLEYLALSSNAFSGGMSDSIRDMRSLRYLYLDSNKITGELPVALGGAVNLRSLNLDYTAISGRVPAVVGRLTNLEYLSMRGCKLSGSIPGEINLLTMLTMLNLDSNALTGELPNLSPMTSLKSLMLVGNRLGGRIDTSFADLRALGKSMGCEGIYWILIVLVDSSLTIAFNFLVSRTTGSQ